MTSEKGEVDLHAHIPSLDGVRGAAIVLVLVHHIASSMSYEFGWNNPLAVLLKFGWCGVDLFFVLSGFLITGILYDSRGSARYYRDFYARRSLRIFPLYFLALAIVLILRNTWNQPDLFGSASPVWPWVYLTNVGLSLEGYGAFGLLDHFWSLSVEEHFYLVWPFAVLWMTRRQLMLLAAGMIGCALFFRCVLVLQDAPAAMLYTLTPLRMDSLAVGGFIALAARGPGGVGQLARYAWGVLAVAAGVVLMIVVGRKTLEHGDPFMQSVGYSAIAILFGALLVLAISNAAIMFVFSNRCLRWFGMYSYGLYVWHPIIFVLMWHSDAARAIRGGSSPTHMVVSLAVAVAVSFAVALLSYHLWEKKFLSLKKHFETKSPHAPVTEVSLPAGSTPIAGK